MARSIAAKTVEIVRFMEKLFCDRLTVRFINVTALYKGTTILSDEYFP